MWGVVATDILFGIELEITARWPCSPPSRQGKLEHVKVRRCVYIARVASDESQIAMVNDVKVSTVVVFMASPNMVSNKLKNQLLL